MKNTARAVAQIYIMAEGMRHRGISPREAFTRAAEIIWFLWPLPTAPKNGIRIDDTVNAFISDTLKI